jgi:hypothetical protein
MAEFWDIDQGIEDPERFFELVGDIFPEATHLFVEGSSVAAARAAPSASSRPFPRPGPSPLSHSSVTSFSGTLSRSAGRAHLSPLSGVPEEEVGSSPRVDSVQAHGRVTVARAFCLTDSECWG